MRALGKSLCFLALAAFVAGSVTTPTARSGEDKDLRAVIAKGLKAIGGEEAAAKHKVVYLKGSGTFFGLGEGIPYDGEWHFHADKQSRFSLEIKVMDQAIKLVQIVSNDKGWVKLNNDVKEMSADELAEEKNDLYANWVTSLAPLKDKAFKLAAGGDVKIGDKEVVVLRVSHEGRRDINLFFDKTSGLLSKAEYQVRDVKGGGNKEMNQEIFYSEYKDAHGLKQATKIVMKRDGKVFVDATFTEIRPLEAADANLFAKPQ